jgi:H+-transporting ATPase
MPIMIWLAAIVEAAIQNWIDMGILLGIQFLNASLSYYETTKAGDAVAALRVSSISLNSLPCLSFAKGLS